MGALCSRSEPDEDCDHSSKESITTPTMKQHPINAHPATRMAEQAAARALIDAHDANAAGLDPEAAPAWKPVNPDAGYSSAEAYFAQRNLVLAREQQLGFEARCRAQASPAERRADAIVQSLKRRDQARVYDEAEPRTGFAGQKHPRFAGDHFLSNRPLIEQTDLFRVAGRMPKGAHLHIHFNACLAPHVLLNIAKRMDRMFITSDLALVDDRAFARSEIQFSLLSADKEKPGNLFSRDYEPRQTMKFQDFLDQFSRYYSKSTADQWLLEKLMFNEDETHNVYQTASGAWEKFNGRTRMMKGLFNYETAYKEYTRLCLEDFMKDNIQYAEIRPNFMMSNQLCHDDGSGSIDNWGIMRIIIKEVEAFQAENRKKGIEFGGLKVIYCTPRSFNPDNVKAALDQCIEFKKEWPQWIAGFDLVGEEGKGRPLKDFVSQFLEFQENCRKANLDIPFLFHCGETLDLGTDTDANLVDALLLNSKRIGHGFALSKHPYIMQHMKERNVCLELCPISNEILGLTPRVSGHSMYELLANNVHCTVSSDNGTLFRSSLSHDFYQVMVGKADMSIFGWKQLVLWSLEHACLDETEYNRIYTLWKHSWDDFIKWVIQEYSSEPKLA